MPADATVRLSAVWPRDLLVSDQLIESVHDHVQFLGRSLVDHPFEGLDRDRSDVADFCPRPFGERRAPQLESQREPGAWDRLMSAMAMTVPE